MTDNTRHWLDTARQVLTIERDAIDDICQTLGDEFITAIKTLKSTRGKVVCCGVGKSAKIASKIAATFSSTGTPAFFMHAAEAGHGDLGVVNRHDVILFISYSGETEEILNLLPALKQVGIPVIAMVGKAESSLARAAQVCLLTTVAQEACPHNLAPTASTTAALALGDALAMTLLHTRGFSPEDFARTHPFGQLGRRLLLRVSDVMRSDNDIPFITADADFDRLLLEMTAKRMGMTLIGTPDRQLLGIFTDGDLRRAMDKHKGLRAVPVRELMNPNPRTIAPDALAADALAYLQNNTINHLPVVDDDKKIVGALIIHDLMSL